MKDQLVSTQAQLEKLLGEITMKNTSLDFNWRFEIDGKLLPVQHGWLVRVAFDRPDTETGKVGTGYGRWEYIGINTTESGAVKTAWLLIELVVRHELMEAFRWRNARIFNPHNSIYDLAAVQSNHGK